MRLTSSIHTKIFQFLISLAVFTLPFSIYLMLPIAILLFLNWLIEGNFKAKFLLLRKPNRIIPFLLMLGFFLCHLFSLFYGNNISATWSNLECKIWFLLVPLVLFTADHNSLNSQFFRRLAFLFVIASVMMILINLVWSFVRWSQKDFQLFGRFFYYVNVTHLFPPHPTHPSYLAMYLSVATFIAIKLCFHIPSHISHRKFIIFGLIFSIFLFIVFILLLQSKAGLLVFFPLLLVVLLYLFNRNKRRVLESIAILGVLCAMVIPMFVHVSGNGNRLKQAYHEMILQKNEPKQSQKGVGVRVTIWTNAWEVFCENPFLGVGVGDVVDTLSEAYADENLSIMVKHRFNAHNQYLQTAVGMGFCGLLILLALLIYPCVVAIRSRDALLLLFLLIVAGNLLVESMFEVRAGATFFPLFYALFYLRTIQSRKV